MVRICSSRMTLSRLSPQDDAVAVEPDAAAVQFDMRGKLCLSHLGRDGRGYDRGAVAVAGIVLDDQNRAHAALFAADDRAEVGKVNIASFDHV